MGKGIQIMLYVFFFFFPCARILLERYRTVIRLVDDLFAKEDGNAAMLTQEQLREFFAVLLGHLCADPADPDNVESCK